MHDGVTGDNFTRPINLNIGLPFQDIYLMYLNIVLIVVGVFGAGVLISGAVTFPLRPPNTSDAAYTDLVVHSISFIMFMAGLAVVSCTSFIHYMMRRKKPVVTHEQEGISPTAVWAVRVSLKETT